MNPDPLYVSEDEPTCANCLRRVSEVDAETGECRSCFYGSASRAGWLIPLILIAVVVAAVAWRLRP